MIKFLLLGGIAGWMMGWYENHGIDCLLLILAMIEIGLFFNCVGLI
jgi:hypothetical protein